MIDLTIKTLDSQNHAFSVEDDITVAQFKERIAEVINIPPDTQRLIYCGRVLQDNKKLQEYDVNGKVVHLVQRAPPSATRRARSPQPTHQPLRRPFSTANAMYLGSMAFPSGLMEAQGIVPPPPTQSLSGSRLNVARRMIRRAENILNNLEDPQGSRSRESPPEEPQDDVTPVFAAQVFVPDSHNDDPLASLTAAVSAVQNGILQAEQVATTRESAANSEESTATAAPEVAAAASTTSTEAPEAATATSSSTSNSTQPDANANANNANGGSGSAGGRLPENAFGTIEMSRLLDDLNKIHERLRPFMERYHAFMRNDPPLNSDQISNQRQTQTIINRVSEVMHLLGHAYHSLSDVMVLVSTPPPRPLLCRPILIQHSAVVQAGIPIQVEAQINLTSDRRPSDNATQQSNQGSGETQNPAEGANTTSSGTTPPQPTITTSQIRPNVHEIRIDSFPFELRGFPRPPVFNITHQGLRHPPTGNNDTGTQATPTSGTETNTAGQGPNEPVVAVVPPFVNNPNMEFFMEVTPESITIDSLETTVVTSAAQADNVLRGTFGSTPPEFIQSILQAVAGQMMGGAAPPTPSSQPPTTASTESSEQTSTAQSTTGGTNVNSQARGNTQTHPTTATQTRSTSRPHVHLAQHTMQGFDPFLPCNSHHIRRRRVPAEATASVPTAATAAPPAGNQNSTPTEASGEQQNNNQFPNPLYNILQGWFRTLGNAQNRPQQQQTRSETQEPNTTASAPPESSVPSVNPGEPVQIPLPFMDIADLSRLLFDQSTSGQATLDTFLQHFPEHHYNEGESIFTDLVMTLARGLTFGDVIALNTGHIDPLVRIRPQLRTFFRVRVLNSDCPTQAAIDRGSDRLIHELQPILELMNTMRVRDNIDIVQSATQLCRSRFPNIISLLMSRMTGSLRSLVDQCLLTVRQLCALALHSSADGQEGVEEVFRALIARYTAGISPEIHQWTISTSLSQLRHFLRNLNVPQTAIQPYIVLRTPRNESSNAISESEAMEVEEVPIIVTPEEATTVPILNSGIDTEPLPNVVIGSEPWHRGLSADWIPIITRDNQRQRRQNPQAPFSDAYLSGMPSKRRKIVAASKPHGNLSQVISDGVRRAVQTTGLTNAVPLDVVSQAASSDVSLQSAYRDLLRTNVQSGLRDNPEFTPERFPNAANYFNVNK